MMSELRDLFGAWIAAVAAAIRAVTARIVPHRRILFVEGEGFSFAARVISAGEHVVTEFEYVQRSSTMRGVES